MLQAAVRLKRHDGQPFTIDNLVRETIAGGTTYSTDTIHRTIRRMRGQRGDPDHAEFDSLSDGRLRLRAGTALASKA